MQSAVESCAAGIVTIVQVEIKSSKVFQNAVGLWWSEYVQRFFGFSGIVEIEY